MQHGGTLDQVDHGHGEDVNHASYLEFEQRCTQDDATRRKEQRPGMTVVVPGTTSI